MSALPPLSANAGWLARSRAAVWHPCTQMKQHETLPLVPIARGEGAWLVDFDGRRYLDAVSSWWVNLFGHAHPRINAALRAQLDDLEHVILAGFTHATVVELSERLAALAPPGLGHAFYGSDGASATEIALKMSFHAWSNRGAPEKREFVSLEGSYHGETLGALAVTDVPLFRDTYAPLLRRCATVPSPDARRARPGESASDVAERAAQGLEAHLAAHHATTAALIVEPLVQGASGMAMHDPRYLARARELCTRFGVHLIADEIMTGFGRTGTLFACEQAGVSPDFLLLSKGLTGGYLPLACVLTTDEVYAAFWDDDTARGFLHSHSYTGNALACRAALAVLDIFRDDDVIAANRAKAQRWAARAAALAAHPRARNFRNRGMIWAFEADNPRPDFARWCFARALARGVLLRPIGRTVYFMPPYVVTDDEFALLCDTAAEVLDAA
ncbi:MAG: adenosylmethionine--8-amino-7-oxononanoate transaminase [Betaproteobacteria bacterium]|nr:adenosylmethionine--8-amino-7-oxononanoate transaminase [Betaproteobacteria bacterium]MDH5286275.1 adenosylmethionine--8-amino-7-oxononanoate transaminase [Betaproteobacteria bacterium]